MDSTLTFQDIFKKSFLEAGSFLQGFTVENVLQTTAYLLVSLLIGLLLYVLYRRTYAGVVYSSTFAVSLIGMTVLTCGIIVTIQSNITLSLGMVGALSIVRYRTAIKDPMDLLYLFWAVASGIAVGAGMFYVAVVVLVIMTVLLLILKNRKSPRDEMYVLLVHYNADGVDEMIRRVLGTRPYKIKSKTLRKQDVEMAVEVRVRRGGTGFVDALRRVEGIQDVTLIQYSGDYIE
ncbi:MAG: DUF4956 domain-containing protein [Eubacteriales bacterium]|nr:DUF4956 domain-containing protein [Eubacteriales bacterium]